MNEKFSNECLDDIKRLAIKRDSRLRDIGSPDLGQGGCLLLGSCYAKAPYVFCGLNPGGNGDTFVLGPCSCEPWNSPFSNDPEEDNASYAYWRNCQSFIQSNGLGPWFNDVTSTFLVPWRTGNEAALESLNQSTDGKLFRYAGEILSKIIEHHEAKVLILAGKSSIRLLKRILSSFDGTKLPGEARYVFLDDSMSFCGPGGTYQWSEMSVKIGEREIRVFQVPHFSRANSKEKMSKCANWLQSKLIDYGFKNGR